MQELGLFFLYSDAASQTSVSLIMLQLILSEEPFNGRAILAVVLSLVWHKVSSSVNIPVMQTDVKTLPDGHSIWYLHEHLQAFSMHSLG